MIDTARRRVLGGLVAGALAAHGAASGAATAAAVDVHLDDALAGYGFPPPHPFGTWRGPAFEQAARRAGLLAHCARPATRLATRAELLRFHTPAHVDLVMTALPAQRPFLDDGDTPVVAGLHAHAAAVVGAALVGLERVLRGDAHRSLQPVGGLHHAARDKAAGFCVYNDVGVVIETLRRVHGFARVAYVDIDAHHGDGVFYAFLQDPGVIFADLHQDGSTLFPGSGRADERGAGEAVGTKLNVELAPRSGDAEFLQAWPAVEAHLEAHAPQFFLLQCGADGLAGDPLAQLEYTSAVHAHVTRRLRALAARHAQGRLMCFGGGGYLADNLAQAWCAVLAALLA